MYYDVNNHIETIKTHAILKALCGDNSEIEHVPEEMNNYDHDTNVITSYSIHYTKLYEK